MRLLTILLLLSSSLVFAQQTETENKTDESLKVAVGLSAGVHYFNSLNYSIDRSGDSVFDVNFPVSSAFTANCMLIKPVMPRLSLVVDVSGGYKTYQGSFVETYDQDRREININTQLTTFSVLVGPHFQKVKAKYPFFINCKAGLGSNRLQRDNYTINSVVGKDIRNNPSWYSQFMTSLGVSPTPKTTVELFFLGSVSKDEPFFGIGVIQSSFKSNSQVYGIRFSYLLRD
jgi:hypothetical protein